MGSAASLRWFRPAWSGRKTVTRTCHVYRRLQAQHGAFKSGDLALQNHGSHYGFIENGVVFSKLQPGLATVFVLDDGSIVLKTWRERRTRLLDGSNMRGRMECRSWNSMRRRDDRSRPSGRRWGPGNWSGSEDEKLRTIARDSPSRRGRKSS